MTARKPPFTNNEAPVALYLFNERGGNIVHNQLDTATDLQAPSKYFILRPRLLVPIWYQYRYGWPAWSYWNDVLVNIFGFVPCGFFWAYYLYVVRPTKLSGATIIIGGFVLSLTIETLQRFLPTRNSDMTDLVSNTIGTSIGLVLYRCQLLQRAWNRVPAHRVNIQ